MFGFHYCSFYSLLLLCGSNSFKDLLMRERVRDLEKQREENLPFAGSSFNNGKSQG